MPRRTMPSRMLWILLASLSMIISASVSLYGQSTYGSITGSVADNSGAIVTEAAVTLTNSGTGEKRSQSSGADGLFTFVNLFPGQYRLDVEKTGFKHFLRNLTVEVQQDTHVVASLQVGEVSQVVEVTSESPLLQTESASLGQVVEQRKADELPLNGRNIFNLIIISPAAVAQGGSGGSPVGQNPFSWGNYQIGGSFANQGAEYLDGQPLNIGYINLPVIIPTQDSIGEFKVQYNNLGAEWGKFSGGITNLSTKSGSNAFHGSVYEFFRNRVLNANEYFNKQDELLAGSPNKATPWEQNQYGFQVGGPVIKDKTFFYTSWEQYRQRTSAPFITTVPAAGFLSGNFGALCGAAGGSFSGAGICSAAAGQIYDPFTVNTTTGARSPYPNNVIPTGELSTAAGVLGALYYPAPNLPGVTNNYSTAYPTGGNTTEFVARGDQNLGANTRLFGRFSYYGLLDLPENPLGTGLCLDRCAEDYHSKLLAIDLNHSFSSTTIFDINFSGSRFIYGRQPLLSGYDLTALGWPASYNVAPPSSARTPPTPEFPFPNDVGHSQGNSAIGDHNTQYNVSPQFTLIRGKHTIQAGAQWELGLDNYFQTNIATGAFGFQGNWTSSSPSASDGSGFPTADFVLGLALNQGSFAGNQSEGIAQVPAQTQGKQDYRALYVNDTWHMTPKFTASLGLRYELQGTWSEAYNRLTYWDPTATNGTVTGCSGVAGSACPGDAMYVGNGPNSSNNNLPLDKKAFSPRIGLVYSLDPKTVIRAGYGVFFIPNYVSFALNPDNDVVNLAATDFTATTDSYITPAATLDGNGCSFGFSGTSVLPATYPGGFGCANSGPFSAGTIVAPPGRNAQPNLSAFIAANGSPTLAPYSGVNGSGGPKYGYVEQYNFDIQRQLPAGFFADVAYAGSHGVHLQQYSTNIDQIPDSFVAQAAAQAAAGATPTIATQITNPMAGTSANTTIGGPMIAAGQFDRPYPEYTGLNLGGYGCCESSYNSLQATVTRRFQGGGTLLVAYTNAKLMSNTDTLTSWLESNTGGVGAVQDWNNLKGERSLSSQDVSQRLVVSYVLDLPFGHGKAYASNLSGIANGVVSGWGLNGITTFQRGFPLKISWAGTPTGIESANLGVANIRPDVVSGCSKKSGGNHVSTNVAGDPELWFNTSCFAAPPQWGFGSEARADSTLRTPGIDNFDFAIFKRTQVTEKVGIEFRTEIFNLFNHPYFAPPGEGYNGTPTGNGFGQVTGTVFGGSANPERLIQFALKVVF